MKNKIILLSGLMFLTIVSPLAALNSADYIFADSEVIHLIGGNHIDLKDEAVHNLLIELSKRCEIITANEGVGLNEFPEYNCYLGIEDLELHSFCELQDWYYKTAHTYIFNKFLHSLRQQGDDDSADQISSTLAQRFFAKSQAWELSKRVVYLNYHCDMAILGTLSSKYPAINKMFARLSNVYENGSTKEFEALLNDYTKSNSIESPFFLRFDKNFANWINFYADLIKLTHFRTPAIIKNKLDKKFAQHKVALGKYLKNPSKITMSDIPALIKTMEGVRSDLKLARMDIRNQEFLKNIITHFEKNKDRRLPFYVIVGAAHIPFLVAELEDRGYAVSLNERGQEEL